MKRFGNDVEFSMKRLRLEDVFDKIKELEDLDRIERRGFDLLQPLENASHQDKLENQKQTELLEHEEYLESQMKLESKEDVRRTIKLQHESPINSDSEIESDDSADEVMNAVKSFESMKVSTMNTQSIRGNQKSSMGNILFISRQKKLSFF